FAADGGRFFKETLGRDKAAPQIAQLTLLAGRSRRTLAVLGGLLRLLGQPSMARGLAAFGHRDTSHYWRLLAAPQGYPARLRAPRGRSLPPPPPGRARPPSPPAAPRALAPAGPHPLLHTRPGSPAGITPFTRVRPDEEAGRAPSRDMVERTALKVEQGSAGLP